MNLFIGIDLGTSAMKLLLADQQGTILKSVTRAYPLHMPQPGWSEQQPGDWWEACVSGLASLLQGYEPRQVRGIAVAGQMHGLVVLDNEDRVIRPAILWNDGRAFREVEYLNETIGRERLSRCTANIAYAGFTAPKLLWMRNEEPEAFGRIHKVMLPKDYLVYRLTGTYSTDYSDASGTLLLDVGNRCWSDEMLRLCGLCREQLPRLYESWSPVGSLLPQVAKLTGLSAEALVCAGAGDNAAAAIGTGTVGEGKCNLSIGTSGTIFLSSGAFRRDGRNALHNFAHADGGFHLMGCMLSAASCNQWLCERILQTGDYGAEQAAVLPSMLGRNQVYFLPYLMGERSPINDTSARGLFMGMTMSSARAQLVQAVLEGVAFAIRDSFEVARGLGLAIPRSCICGGGSKSALWRTIFANVLGIPLDVVKTEQGPGYGAALLAMVGCGVYPDVRQAAAQLVEVAETIHPQDELTGLYAERYEGFRRIYPACKELFAALAQ